MADFPEKETNDIEEVSTIFSDPTVHNDTNKKDKKVLPKILAGALALCVLIGSTVAVIKLIPVLDDGTTTSSTPDNTISVKKVDVADVNNVTVLNAGGTTEICAETKDDETTWYTKQVAKELTSSDSIKSVVTAVADIKASQEITKKTAAECGLENPAIKATVALKDGKSYEITLGGKSPDNSGYYLGISDKIYLVLESVYEALNFNILDFANTDNIECFGTETETFDSLIVSGKNFPQTVNIVKNEDNEISEYYRYLVVSPQKRLAKGIENVLPLYQDGILVAGAYAYDVSAASLAKVGLDNPDLITTMTVGDKTITYKFALQEDGDYAVVSTNSKLIHKVAASNIGVLPSYTAVDFYENVLFTANIDDVSELIFETKDKSYKFGITANGEDAEEPFTVIYNGDKKLICSNFQNFYRECISITTQDHTTESITPTADMAIRVKYHDGTQTNIIFTRVNTTRYQSTVDGIDMGKVTASALNEIANLAEKLIKGETIE